MAQLIQSLSLNSIDEHTGKVMLDLDAVEELAHFTSQLCDLDQHTLRSCQQLVSSAKSASHAFDCLRKDLKGLRHEVTAGKQFLVKTSASLSAVINEFRLRCREELVSHLQEIDLELRKIVKPLVPNKVMEESIKYRPINSNPSLLNSQASSQQSVQGTTKHSDTRASEETKAESHLQMLVVTLETVAKELINVIFAVDHKYYELVDPTELNSKPPTPLAAKLPEYFSFKFEDEESSSGHRKNSFSLSEEAKKKILSKLVEFQINPALLAQRLNKNSLELIRRLLRKVPSTGLPTEEDLELLLNDKFMSVVDKEELVFDLINSDTFDEVVTAKASEASQAVKQATKFKRKLDMHEKSKKLRDLRRQSTLTEDKFCVDNLKSFNENRYCLPAKQAGADLDMSPRSAPHGRKVRPISRIFNYDTTRSKPTVSGDDLDSSPFSGRSKVGSHGRHISKAFKRPARDVSPEVDSGGLARAYSTSKIISLNSRDVRVRSVSPAFVQEPLAKKSRKLQSKGQRKKP
jgi:hypothetical protein